MVKYDFPAGCWGGKDSFPPTTDNSDVILLNCVRIIKKNNNIWIQNLLGAESRTCKQSSIAKAKANRIRLVHSTVLSTYLKYSTLHDTFSLALDIVHYMVPFTNLRYSALYGTFYVLQLSYLYLQ